MVGATAVTSGIASIWSRIFGHWSIEITRWLGRCTLASSNSPAPPRSGRATWSSANSWICGCEVRTRLMKFASSPASIADMKTMTPTPMAIPPMMKRVCSRPSRKSRTAVIHSNGSHLFMAKRLARVDP